MDGRAEVMQRAKPRPSELAEPLASTVLSCALPSALHEAQQLMALPDAAKLAAALVDPEALPAAAAAQLGAVRVDAGQQLRALLTQSVVDSERSKVPARAHAVLRPLSQSK